MLKLVFAFISLTMKLNSCEVIKKNNGEQEIYINLFHTIKKVNGCVFQFLHDVKIKSIVKFSKVDTVKPKC